MGREQSRSLDSDKKFRDRYTTMASLSKTRRNLMLGYISDERTVRAVCLWFKS